MEKKWWIYTVSGECTEVASRDEAMHKLQRFYKERISPEEVITEEEYNARTAAGERLW